MSPCATVGNAQPTTSPRERTHSTDRRRRLFVADSLGLSRTPGHTTLVSDPVKFYASAGEGASRRADSTGLGAPQLAASLSSRIMQCVSSISPTETTAALIYQTTHYLATARAPLARRNRPPSVVLLALLAECTSGTRPGDSVPPGSSPALETLPIHTGGLFTVAEGYIYAYSSGYGGDSNFVPGHNKRTARIRSERESPDSAISDLGALLFLSCRSVFLIVRRGFLDFNVFLYNYCTTEICTLFTSIWLTV